MVFHGELDSTALRQHVMLPPKETRAMLRQSELTLDSAGTSSCLADRSMALLIRLALSACILAGNLLKASSCTPLSAIAS
jgi:hypothetical protein